MNTQTPLRPSARFVGRLTLPFAALVLLVSATACAPAKTIEIQRTVEQTALVPAPGGPSASGKLTEAGKMAFSAGYSGSALFAEDNRSVYETQTGNVVLNHAANVWFGGAAGSWEFGLNMAYANADWGASLSSDTTSVEEMKTQHSFRAGPTLRGLFFNRGGNGMGILFETEIGNVPYRQEIYEKAYLTTHTYEGDPAWWRHSEARTRFLGERQLVRDQNDLQLWAKFGMWGQFNILDIVGLTIGMMGQTHPVYFGSDVIVERCTRYDNGEEVCSGDSLDDIDPDTTELLGTVFASASYQVGPAVFIVEFYGHPLASRSDIIEATPFGGSAAVRLEF